MSHSKVGCGSATAGGSLLTPSRIVRFAEVARLVGLSRSTIWRLERQGLFPKRILLSARAVGWLEADIERWLASRQASGFRADEDGTDTGSHSSVG
jgi:prophage regulatory protein